MYKIFHENKALIFPKIEGNSLKLDATLQESDRYDAELLCDFLPEWLDDRDPGDTFIHEVGENAVASALKETFKMAPAAGGVVIMNGKIASITRHDIPDLPKGHIEDGEDAAHAALREVEEETGLAGLSIVRQLPTSWHCYLYEDEWRLKPTYWYLMSTDNTENTQPQTDEDITEVTFLGTYDVEWFLENTYRSIAETLGNDIKSMI